MCTFAHVTDVLWQRQSNKKGLDPANGFSPTFLSNCKVLADRNRNLYIENAFTKLAFFVSELPESYTESPRKLNKYFETMNSAGRSLEQHEKLKVELLKICPDGQPKELFNAIWNEVERMDKRILCDEENGDSIDDEIEAICQKESPEKLAIKGKRYHENKIKVKDIMPSNEKPGVQQNIKEVGSVIGFQELLILALNITLDKEYELDKYKLEKTFKDFPAEKVPNFYWNLYKIRLLLDRYVIRVEKENGRNTYKLRFTDEDAMTEDEHKLVQYQSMLYVSTSAKSWLTPYIEWLIEDKNHRKPDAPTLLKELKEIDNRLHTFKPVEDMVYDRDEGKVLERYWFWRLDYYLWERRHEFFKDDEQKIAKWYIFRTNRSIEHLHPWNQNLNEKWEKEDVKSFGNLAMISASFNSQQSNDPVRIKFARVEAQINNKDLESLKMYKMYLDAKDNENIWTKEIMKNHEKEMYEILKQSYDNK